MINFDEAIKQFHPSLEINEVEQAVKKENAVEDITDIMLEIMNQTSKKGK
ncbi:MAG: hypothetical protein IKG67_08155 [Parasporobacterium sp.]|nr:hypothetical protein [Parasporobacterium sp.]MBR3402199.1 hypothetical protein [Parasporobacterium sp.]